MAYYSRMVLVLQSCCICLARYGDDEEDRELPCVHVFHVDYVENGLKSMPHALSVKMRSEKAALLPHRTKTAWKQRVRLFSNYLDASSFCFVFK